MSEWQDKEERLMKKIKPPPAPAVAPFERRVEVTPAVLAWLEQDPESSCFEFAAILRGNQTRQVLVRGGGSRYTIELPAGTDPGAHADVLDRQVNVDNPLKVFDTPVPACLGG